MGKIRQSIFAVLGKAYAFEVLRFLEENPSSRFTDISPACRQEKVRAQRLRELEKEKLIEVKVKRVKGRAIQFYSLSNKGKEILSHMREIDRVYKTMSQ